MSVSLITLTAMTNDSERPGQLLYLRVLGLRTDILRQQEGGMLSSGIGRSGQPASARRRGSPAHSELYQRINSD